MMDKIKKLYLNISNNKLISLFYIIGVCIYAFIVINQYSLVFNINGIYKSMLRIASFLLMFPKIVFQKYSKDELRTVILMLAFSLFCILVGGDKNILIIPVVLIGIKGEDIRKIVKYIFIINLSSLILHFIVFVINYYLKNNGLSSIFHFMWREVENNLMFTNRNLFAFRYACLFLQYLYITDRNNKRLIKIVVLLLFAIFGYQISNSRTSLLLSIMIIIYLLIEKNVFIIKRLKIITTLSLIVGLILSFIIVYCGKRYEEPFFSNISKLLSGRPHYLYDIYKYIGINLLPSFHKFNSIREYFGRNIVIVPDNSYLSILFKWGLLVFVVLLCFVIYFLLNNKNDIYTYYCASIMLFSFTFEYYSPDFIIYIVPLLVMHNYFNNNSI